MLNHEHYSSIRTKKTISKYKIVYIQIYIRMSVMHKYTVCTVTAVHVRRHKHEYMYVPSHTTQYKDNTKFMYAFFKWG